MTEPLARRQWPSTALSPKKSSDIVCVYVAIGQMSSSVQRAINAVREHGAFDRCIFVVAGASASSGMRWIAPFAGFTMAEYYRDRGQHALIAIDDMTKHAVTHREIAPLTRQPPVHHGGCENKHLDKARDTLHQGKADSPAENYNRARRTRGGG